MVDWPPEVDGAAWAAGAVVGVGPAAGAVVGFAACAVAAVGCATGALVGWVAEVFAAAWDEDEPAAALEIKGL